MPNILIIEDDEAIRGLYRIALTRAGYSVIEAEDGKDGLKKFDSNPIDLVITDIVMPEKEGIETIIELRAKSPEAKIIAISGGGKVTPDNYLLTAKKLGANRVFAKPLDMKVLLGAIEELIA